MKNTLLAIAASALFSVANAQTAPAEKTFPIKIEGTAKNFKGKFVYLHHKWNEENITDSAKVINGKFTFNVKSSEANMYWFTLDKEMNAQPNYIFFADGAAMRASIKGDSLAFSSIEGGQAQKDYIDYRTVINNFIKIQENMQLEYKTATENNDVNKQNSIKNEYQNLNTQFLGGIKNFVKTHPKSPVSGFILYSDFSNPQIPISELEEAISYVDKSLENSKFFKMAKKRVDDLRGTMVGYPANDFTQATPEGKKVSLSDFKGKYVLIDFWASWCRPCRAENPNVVKAYNQFKDKGFTVLGVSLDQNMDQWVNAIKADNLTWTQVSDLKGWGNEVGKMYGVTGIPQNYLIDKDGKIVAKDLRGPALEEKLAELLK
ncbi:MAG: AhpC/TSA family protein [Bacteroidia bacterium]|nr:AhpC/TSA family protein [Bacteroidia bacterium]